MEILTSVKRLYISFKSLVNDFVYSFGRAALLLLVEVQNHTVPIRERGRVRVNTRWFKYDRGLCGLFTHKSVPVIFELPCTYAYYTRIPSVNSLSTFQSEKCLEQQMYRNQNTHFITNAFLLQILWSSRQTKVVLMLCHNYVTYHHTRWFYATFNTSSKFSTNKLKFQLRFPT